MSCPLIPPSAQVPVAPDSTPFHPTSMARGSGLGCFRGWVLHQILLPSSPAPFVLSSPSPPRCSSVPPCKQLLTAAVGGAGLGCVVPSLCRFPPLLLLLSHPPCCCPILPVVVVVPFPPLSVVVVIVSSPPPRLPPPVVPVPCCLSSVPLHLPSPSFPSPSPSSPSPFVSVPRRLCPLLFHPSTTPRAVAHEAREGWCGIVMWRQRHWHWRWCELLISSKLQPKKCTVDHHNRRNIRYW